MNAQAAYGLIAHALIFGSLAGLFPLGEFRARVGLAATTLALLVGIAPGLHGMFGLPSATLLQLALLQLAGRTPSPLSWRPALGLLAFAALFYGTAHGLGPFDPYPLGYQPWPLVVALIPMAGALWWRGMPYGLLILAGDLLAYASGVFANLWDALIDPLLVLVAAVVVGRQLALRLIAARNR